MIINELAYKITIKADEFLNGKKKVEEGVKELNTAVTKTTDNINESVESVGETVKKTGKSVRDSNKKTDKSLKELIKDIKGFGNASVSAFRGVTTAAAGFLGISASLYGIKQLFTSTANEIVRASQQARFFGSDVNKMFGMQRGFRQAGLNGDAFISASGNVRMALANIADPTVFGGLTGAAQNLMVLGARTGLNINNLGDPNKALSEFTRYGKSHSQENLMQVMAAAGFDPTDAAKIKSGELKQLVDSETKKSHITDKQVKEQEKLFVTLGQLDAEFNRIKQDLAIAFAPDVLNAMKEFGSWIEKNQGNIVGFFKEAGDKVKAFTEAVGGAENALKILAGLYVGSKVMSGAGGGLKGKALAAGGIWAFGQAVQGQYDNVRDEDRPFIFQQHWLERLLGMDYQDSVPPSAKNSSGRTLADKNNNPGNITGSNGLGGFSGYSSEQDGWDAMSNQLMKYFNGTSRAAGYKKLTTVRDIVSTWAPPSENDTAGYIKSVSGFMKVGANDELNLADPNVMAKLRTAMARQEGFSNWQNGLIIAGANKYQSEYYLQQQAWANSRNANSHSRVDNSQSNSTNINTVVVNSNPQTVDALTQSINRQAGRASTNATFASAMR